MRSGRRRIELPFLAALFLAGDASAQSPASRFAIADKSFAYVQVFKDRGTLGSGFSHDHVVAASRFSGTIRLDVRDFVPCRGTIETPVRLLDVDPPGLRESLGYSEIDSDDRRSVRKSMLAKDQLWAERYPTIRFRISSCRADRITGRLTIRGHSRGLDVPATVKVDGDEIRIIAVFELEHRDFGIEPYSALLGAVKNDQPLHFVVRFLLRRAD